jgi:hypothetical protein
MHSTIYIIVHMAYLIVNLCKPIHLLLHAHISNTFYAVLQQVHASSSNASHTFPDTAHVDGGDTSRGIAEQSVSAGGE